MTAPSLSIAERLKRGSVPVADDCRLWQKGKNSKGYGQMKVAGKQVGVNRLACALAHGPSSKDKPFALHTCDTPLCIGHVFTPRGNGSCKHCRREYHLS